jgi:hypothetical protein
MPAAPAAPPVAVAPALANAAPAAPPAAAEPAHAAIPAAAPASAAAPPAPNAPRNARHAAARRPAAPAEAPAMPDGPVVPARAADLAPAGLAPAAAGLAPAPAAPAISSAYEKLKRRMGTAIAEGLARHGPLIDHIQTWMGDAAADAFAIACKEYVAARQATPRDNPRIARAGAALLAGHQDLLPCLNTSKDEGKDGLPGIHKALHDRHDEYVNLPVGQRLPAPELAPRPAELPAAPGDEPPRRITRQERQFLKLCKKGLQRKGLKPSAVREASLMRALRRCSRSWWR